MEWRYIVQFFRASTVDVSEWLSSRRCQTELSVPVDWMVPRPVMGL